MREGGEEDEEAVEAIGGLFGNPDATGTCVT